MDFHLIQSVDNTQDWRKLWKRFPGCFVFQSRVSTKMMVTLTVPLSTQVYKWVQANCWENLTKLWGSDLRWTSIPFRGRRNTSLLRAIETGISSGSYEPGLALRLHSFQRNTHFVNFSCTSWLPLTNSCYHYGKIISSCFTTIGGHLEFRNYGNWNGWRGTSIFEWKSTQSKLKGSFFVLSCIKWYN